MFLSETLATLEGIQKANRGTYFSHAKPIVEIEEEELPDGVIKLGVVVKPYNSLHPGLHHIVEKWCLEALKLGARFMRCPRTGIPKPPEFSQSNYVNESDDEREERQTRHSKILREIEGKDVGISVVKNLGKQINARLGVKQPWFANLDNSQDVHENRAIERAIGE